MTATIFVQISVVLGSVLTAIRSMLVKLKVGTTRFLIKNIWLTCQKRMETRLYTNLQVTLYPL